jgi:radical SAM superfamily enzyme YgiQ (UPF0313 family)
MRVLLISTYELGHQPLHVASPAAALAAAGHEVTCLDLAVEPWQPAAVDAADAVAFSVPMHTAMRLAVAAAEAVKARRPAVPVCFYGLYAPMGRDHTLGRVADRIIAGEYEPGLRAWVDGLAAPPRAGAAAAPAASSDIGRGRATFHRPARHLLPPLDRYARFTDGGEPRLVGYVEASHGCKYACRHCPLPVIYDGAFRVVDADVVLADIAQLVAAGARHITFGDPDFLNGPGHVLPLVRRMHAAYPQLTFDVTTKVEHIARGDPALFAELARCGCRFVVSAVETLNEAILDLLDKGHRAAEAVRAVEVLRAVGIEPRPSFLPFTPWTALDDVVALLDFVIDHDLVGNVDPVQFAIRLLVPAGSLVLERPEILPYLGPYDPEQLSYTWVAADPRVDALQRDLAELTAEHADAGKPPLETFVAIDDVVRAVAGAPPAQLEPGALAGRPRLTEPWFC